MPATIPIDPEDRERMLARLKADIQLGIDALERGDVIAIWSESGRMALIKDIQRRGRERVYFG